MKKVILSLAMVAVATVAFAQKKVVSAAEKNFKKGDLELAISEIDAALENPETKDDPNTQLLKARILTKKFGQDSSNVASTVEIGRSALEQFNKAMEMSGNDKESKIGKEVYKEEIPDLPENFKPYSIRTLKNAAFEKAIKTYENDDMEMAYEFFNLMSDIDPTDTTSSFNAGYIANDLGKYEDAKKQFKKLIEIKEYNKLSCFATFGFFLFSIRLQKQAFQTLLIRDYSLSLVNPVLGVASKNLKAKLLRNFGFFVSHCLQKQAFDACKTKKPAFRLAFEYFGGESGIRTRDKL